MSDGEKKERPQNKNLVDLESRDPEEARAIRSAGGKAKARKIQEEKTRRELFRELVSLGIDGSKGKPVGLDKLKSLDEATQKNITVAAKIAITELQRYLATGDKESRDYIMNSAFPESAPAPEGDTADATVRDDGTVRIHLIRGSKPREEPTPEDGAPHA